MAIHARIGRNPPVIIITIDGPLREPYHIWNMKDAEMFLIELTTAYQRSFVKDLEEREGVPWQNPYGQE